MRSIKKAEGEPLDKALKKRIRQLEGEVKKADIKIREMARIKQQEAEILKRKRQIREVAVTKVSLKGGIFELKKLLKAVEKTKALEREGDNTNPKKDLHTRR